VPVIDEEDQAFVLSNWSKSCRRRVMRMSLRKRPRSRVARGVLG